MTTISPEMLKLIAGGLQQGSKKNSGSSLRSNLVPQMLRPQQQAPLPFLNQQSNNIPIEAIIRLLQQRGAQ